MASSKIRLLIKPYIVTAIPGAVFALSLVAMVEMAHSSEEEFVFLGASFNSSGVLSWAVLVMIALGSFVALRRSLPALREAWAQANTIDSGEQK